jgi:chaperonin GroEL (HSP60 family)
MMKDVARPRRFGDGTATATVLAEAIFEGASTTSAGAHAMA